jgi:transcriptional regulator with XRE-family HTH domain
MLGKLPTNPIDVHVGKKLRQIRKSHKMSQDKLGELTGVAGQQIQKYEMAINRISVSKLYEFSQLLERPISDFFAGCVADRDFHNIDFKSEEDQKINATKNDREVECLIQNFNRVKDFNVREKIIDMVCAVANNSKQW